MTEQKDAVPAEIAVHPRHTERRLALRYRSEREAHCRLLTDGKTISVHVRDISVHGAGILVRRPIHVGTPMSFTIPDGMGGLAVDVAARVVHCTMRNVGNWIVGVIFERRLTDEELQCFI